MPRSLSDDQDALAREMIATAIHLGAESARDAAEIVMGRPLTDGEWRDVRVAWDRNWNADEVPEMVGHTAKTMAHKDRQAAAEDRAIARSAKNAAWMAAAAAVIAAVAAVVAILQ